VDLTPQTHVKRTVKPGVLDTRSSVNGKHTALRNRNVYLLRYQVLTPSVKRTVFWEGAPRSLVETEG
jgi:hypothetical protein